MDLLEWVPPAKLASLFARNRATSPPPHAVIGSRKVVGSSHRDLFIAEPFDAGHSNSADALVLIHHRNTAPYRQTRYFQKTRLLSNQFHSEFRGAPQRYGDLRLSQCSLCRYAVYSIVAL